MLLITSVLDYYTQAFTALAHWHDSLAHLKRMEPILILLVTPGLHLFPVIISQDTHYCFYSITFSSSSPLAWNQMCDDLLCNFSRSFIFFFSHYFTWLVTGITGGFCCRRMLVHFTKNTKLQAQTVHPYEPVGVFVRLLCSRSSPDIQRWDYVEFLSQNRDRPLKGVVQI